MSYSMFLGQLTAKSIEELEELKKKHNANIDAIDQEEIKRLVGKLQDQKDCVKEIDEVIKEKKMQEIEKNLIVNNNHRKLLKAMYFQNYKNGGDYVWMGVDGKRPFGNSSVYSDVARILGWKLPNDDLSDEQYERAGRLLDELPFALNKILEGLE